MLRSLPCVVVLAVPTAAQALQVLPASYATQPGNSAYEVPIGHFYGRVLQVFDDLTLPFQGATLTQLALRRDGVQPLTYASRNRDVVLRMGHTAYTTRTLPTSFAALASGATVVYAGTLSVPFEPPPVGQAAPWSLVLPFAQPWTYARASGRLLFDLEGETRVLTDGAWASDGYWAATDDGRGSRRTLGQPCTSRLGHEVYSGGEPPVPGDVLGVGLQGTLPSSVTTAVIWLGQVRPQPLSLAGVGAPGCSLYVDPLALQGVPVTRFGGELRAAYAQWPTPPLASLNGLVLATQSAVPLPGANALGMLFSDATELTFGTRGTRPFAAQMLWQFGEQSDRGTVGPDERALLVQLGGTFR